MALRETDPRTTTEFPARDTLERTIGKPRGAWSCSDLVDFAVRADVRFVSLMHVGGDGWLKTLDFVPRSAGHLQDILEGGERADGSSLFAGMGIPAGASDVVLRPRPGTAFLDPFAERPTLVVRCGHLDRSGHPLPQSPDTILRAACARLDEELGIELTALGEVEYFLGKPYDPADIYGARDRGYQALAPFVFGQDHRRRAMDLLSGLGVPIKYGHSEVGYIEATEADGILWEQHEIELALQPLPDAADGILLAQWVLRLLAHRAGMRLSTEPMVLAGHAGNGLHFHMSVRENGRHLPVFDSGDALEPNARLLVGGLVRCGGALMAFGNRVASSFGRLSQGKETPGAIRWGRYDRSALVRIPVVPVGADGHAAVQPTVEFRLPDGSAMPHLLLAGVVQAMIGARGDRDLQALIDATSVQPSGNATVHLDPLPRDFPSVAAAVDLQRERLVAGGVFRPEMVDAIIARLRTATGAARGDGSTGR
jgi:glutamine synthetase